MRRFQVWCKRILIGLSLVFVLFWIISGYFIADYALRAKHDNIRPRTDIAGKPIEPVTITTPDGLNLAAWHIRNHSERAVILLSGIRGDRDNSVPNAETYLNLGYSVLMPDLRGTGQSEGEMVSIGWYEKNDLIACFDYMQRLGYKKIGAHGISLGAATICYAAKDLPELDFAVLESSYDTIDHALNNRLALHNIPRFLAWPTKWFAAWRLGVNPHDMRPVDFVSQCKAPTLVMGGDSEGFLKVSETKSIYEHSAAQVKRLHIFKGGRHETFVRRFGDECRTLIASFLQEAATARGTAVASN